MAGKLVVIFVEGDTEEVFYKELLNVLRRKLGNKFNCKIKVKNVKGLGKYKTEVCRIFEKKIKKEYPNMIYDVILCYDTDVFKHAKKPPINWDDVIKVLKDKGAEHVNLIRAEQSIEDWFLYDLDGVLKYLRLKNPIKLSGDNGIDKLEKLFIKANKTYIKGAKCDDFINSLNIEKILCSICEEIMYLCIALGVNCEKVSNTKVITEINT